MECIQRLGPPDQRLLQANAILYPPEMNYRPCIYIAKWEITIWAILRFLHTYEVISNKPAPARLHLLHRLHFLPTIAFPTLVPP
ncbi:hypothetical protein EMCG_02270 [[Emmonsia] crescens]|uniref:Uncharacterized protein n=1 Tax=[Emmonsia] crescens TaxID=73230 RepID=A0A0G2J1R6_9EURO|nr:hypothetical protein EMCG_02270 [Emmonsia crescens UAMH 3008]